MKSWIKQCPALLLFWIVGTAFAGQDRQLIDEVIHLTGLAKQIDEIAAFAVAEIDNRRSALDDDEYRRLHSALANAFDPKRMLEDVTELFRERYDEARLSAWREQLNSPLMHDMFALEEEASRPDNYDAVIGYNRMLEMSPPSPQRVAMLKQLDDATGASQIALNAQLAVLRTLLQTINPSLPENKRMSLLDLENVVDQTRMQLEGALDRVVAATYLYTYRNVSDERLQAYIDAYSTDAGQWAMAMMKDGVDRSLTRAGERIAQR